MNKIVDILNGIAVPDAVYERCALGAAGAAAVIRRRRRFAARAALVAACIVITGGALAISTGGYFRDIKRIDGAVTGVEYLNATAEVVLTASADAKQIGINISFVEPEAAPYSELEAVAPGDMTLRDSSGKTIPFDAQSDGFTLQLLPESTLSDGEYTLITESFYGISKADAPIEIHGRWETEFSIN